ncbi:hypothetical protein Tco_0895636 [Tanacetum coccineum]|uniref:FRIGIDA-like protein n=1 Tax=Tanacetum coccineum TaxID=301880 RepID=A0ABQ5CGC2_9ASTR
MGTIDSMKSVLTQSAIDALCEKYYIPDAGHPELPGHNDRIHNSPIDILPYFQINLSQLSVIAAAKILHQTYVSKWDVLNESVLDEPNLFAEFNVRAARQTCLGAEVRMCIEHVHRGKKRLEGKCGMQANLLKERDADVADLKARLSLKEVEAAEAIRLRGQIANVEAAEAARAGELESLKEQNADLESAAVAKDSEIAKLTQDLSSLQLSCDDLSIKASTLECEKDKLVDQVSVLETTCSGLRDEVSGYKLFKEQIEAVQDVQVKALSNRVSELDANLMGMALHLDEEFYPRYLTTISGGRRILSRGLKLVVIKCLQSPEYLSTLGGAIGRTIDKGMQDVVYALRAVEFPLLSQLASHKDARISDIMDLFRLEGPASKALEVSQLQPSLEQLMLLILRLEDQVVIGETSLSFGLDVGNARVQRLKANAASRQLSISDALVPLIEPLSAENLIGKASTSGVPT